MSSIIQTLPATGRTMRRARLLVTLPAVLLLAGCVTTPYTAPTPDVAASFDAAAPARQANAPVWWQSFRDARMDRLIQAGLARNLTIEEAIAAIDEAEANVGLARANDLPTLSGSAAANRGESQSGAVNTTTSATLSASWLIDIFGGNRASREAAIAQLDAANLSVEAAQYSVASAIATAYIDLRYYQESIALTRQSITSRQETLDLTRSMQEVGQSGRLDVLQAEQAVAQAEADLPTLQINFDQSLNRLATLTASRTAELRPDLQRGGSQPSARFRPSVGVPAEAIRARPDVRIAERNFATAVSRVGVAEAAFYPSLSLSGSITPTSIRGNGSNTTWGFGPSINLPIFSGGANTANLNAAESRAVQANINYRATVLNAVEDIENALVAYNRGSANVAAQRRLVNSTTETVALARESFQAGQVDFFTVLDAERTLLSSRIALAGAVRTLAANYVAVSVAATAPMR